MCRHPWMGICRLASSSGSLQDLFLLLPCPGISSDTPLGGCSSAPLRNQPMPSVYLLKAQLPSSAGLDLLPFFPLLMTDLFPKWRREEMFTLSRKTPPFSGMASLSACWGQSRQSPLVLGIFVIQTWLTSSVTHVTFILHLHPPKILPFNLISKFPLSLTCLKALHLQFSMPELLFTWRFSASSYLSLCSNDSFSGDLLWWLYLNWHPS